VEFETLLRDHADGERTSITGDWHTHSKRVLVASSLRPVPKPRAGSSFTVSLEVVDTSINQTCERLAQCLMPRARVRAYVSGGRATSSITTPSSAHGQTLTGFITAKWSERTAS
jgi:hypothetical protein